MARGSWTKTVPQSWGNSNKTVSMVRTVLSPVVDLFLSIGLVLTTYSSRHLQKNQNTLGVDLGRGPLGGHFWWGGALEGEF